MKSIPDPHKQLNQSNRQSDYVDSYVTASLMTDRPSVSRPVGDIIRTHAERLAEAAEERLRQRQRDLAEQSSTANPPAVRIRAWEKAHALRMPGDATHPVLDVIAQGTGLALEQIHEEQRARLALRTKRSAEQPSGVAEGQPAGAAGDTQIP